MWVDKIEDFMSDLNFLSILSRKESVPTGWHLSSDGNGHTFCGHGHFWHALFQIFRARATRALPIPEISGHGQGFSPMPYGMPSIFGNFAGMGKWAFALFVNLRARALRALDFWPMGGQKRARACPFPSLLAALPENQVGKAGQSMSSKLYGWIWLKLRIFCLWGPRIM